ncbi:hypothetical protein VPJ68_00500, partial [Parabacteroides distasonis]
MKKILFLVAMVLPMVFVGCSETNEQKAQKLIKEHPTNTIGNTIATKNRIFFILLRIKCLTFCKG